MFSVGIDEVGRGCWAGPVVAGAVILDKPIDGLKDSKLLSRLKREELTCEIYAHAIALGVGWVSNLELDEIGITAAVRLAMQRSLRLITSNYDEVIIDGQLNFLNDNPKARAVIKADQTIPSVSAASIIAKVARDNYMRAMAEDFPDYGFEAHVGYGTRLHLERLKVHGASNLHRMSFKPLKLITEQA